MIARFRSLLFLCLLSAFATSLPALGAQATPEGGGRMPVLIAFRQAPGAAEEGIVRGLGGAVRHSFTLVPGLAASLPPAAIAALANNPNVLSIEPDGVVTASSFESELAAAWGVARIGTAVAHAESEFGEGILVGILDSGIDNAHPELNGRYWGGVDYVNGDNDPFDDNGHGSHVAGTIAAERNGNGVVGVAPSVRLRIYKVLDASGYGNWSDIIAALEQAVADGVRVTNHSYGSRTNPGSMVEAAFASAYSNGVLHVAAAGNTGRPNGNGNTVEWPGAFSSVIAVGATDSSNSRARFSSTGPAVELAAPGVGVLSTVPGGGFEAWNGTSMASPHVAGTAALLISACAPDSPDATRALLRTTSSDLGSPGADPLFGFGLVNAAAAATCGAGDPPPGDDPPPTGDEGTASVEAIHYATSGGRNGDRHLQVSLGLIDPAGTGISGAAITIRLAAAGQSWTTSGTTANGEVSFTLNNAPPGSYTTTILSVAADGYEWDGVTPANGFTKN